MTKQINKFDSFGEMLAYAKTNPHTTYSSNTSDYNFTRTKTMAEAVDLAWNGWTEERDNLNAMLTQLQDQIGERFSKENRTQIGMVGGGVHMGRFLSGRPDHMVGFKRVPTAKMGKIVRIVLDYGANGSTSASDMLQRGVTLTALVDLLGTMGISVELWGETTVKVGDKGQHTTLVKLHDPREPLDIDSLMFAIAHPSMLRRLTFAVREMWEGGVQKMSSHGHGKSIPITMAGELNSDIIINRIEHGGDNKIINKPVEWVMQTIKGLGLA